MYRAFMRPLPALLVALLLAAAPVAGIGTPMVQSDAGTSYSVTVVENTTNQLSIPEEDVDQSTYSDAGIDIGTTVETGSTQLHHRHDALAFEERFRQADSRAARSRLVGDQLATVESEYAQLDSQQDTAIAEFVAGETTAAEFLRTRMVVNAEATELLSTLNTVSSAPDTTTDYSLSQSQTDRLRTVEGDLQTLNGPVGDRLQADATSAESQTMVYLEASDSAYMLATVTDDEYVRETRLDDERNATLPDQFLAAAENDSETDRFDAADERASELYTWLYDRQRPSFTYYGSSGIYEFTAIHPNGELTSYIDAGTTDVFFEAQTRELGGIDDTTSETSVNDTLRVSLRRSTSTGPMLVSATNNETGATVNATVTIDGHEVGSTGSDGVLWTVEPSGDYTVNATTSDNRTTVSVADGS